MRKSAVTYGSSRDPSFGGDVAIAPRGFVLSATLRRALAAAACAAAAGVIALPSASAQPADPPAAQSDMPIFLRRGLPGPGHDALKPLEGTWRVEMSVYMVLGTPEKPAVSTDIVCRREWVAGGRYLRDVTEGTFAATPYYRQGLLGYSNVDRRYEWVTIDGANANMMIYLGAAGTGPRLPIEMSGVFTDQGWLGEATAGKPVGMRTVIKIESADRHVFELFFTPSGGQEMLVDRKVYTRLAK